MSSRSCLLWSGRSPWKPTGSLLQPPPSLLMMGSRFPRYMGDPPSSSVDKARLSPVDVLVCTFNSGHQLEGVLESVQKHVPVHRLILVDRFSTDRTVEIARNLGAEVYSLEAGLGQARPLALRLASTPNVLFLDSDVTLRRPDFYTEALRLLDLPRTGAVVGAAVGHRFLFGIPMGLTLLRRAWGLSVQIPPDAPEGRETYYFARRLAKDRLRVRYVPDAMEHRSTYRTRTWPEWQGAQTRLTAGLSPREVSYALLVILLIHSNSRRPRNVLYTPIFFLKFLRGYLAPERWQFRDRRVITPR